MPRIFLSYSHDSDEHKAWALALAERLRADGLDARIDQYVKGTPKKGWPAWMLDEFDAAESVLVVCSGPYYQRYRGQEEPGKGKGAAWEGALMTQQIYDARGETVKFVPVMREPGLEDFRPEPIRGHTFYELTSEATYEALRTFLQGEAGIQPGPLGPLKPVSRKTPNPLAFDSPQRIAPSRLPHTGARLFGREAELARLDAAWEGPAVHLVTLVAWGGVGKTALVAQWAAGLAARNHDGADYFDWSFYSQGTREQGGPSADPFVDAALRFFGDEVMADSARSGWDKGARLAELVATRRALLVLDGLEPLQYPPGPTTGELKDQALAALLKGLAARNAGLCLVTTRERVADLAAFEGSTAPRWELERLSVPAGVELLQSLAVKGPVSELEEVVTEVRGHALTLNLLGRYLRDAHESDVRRRDRVHFEEADAEVQGGHAFRVMGAYERWLAEDEEQGERLLAILRLLGLFDRAATPDCLEALRREPAIPGLTEPLVGLSETRWNTSVRRLADRGLVRAEDGTLDAHPLLREHFGARLLDKHLEAWRAAHGRLFDHLKDSTEHQPNTLAKLQPLYQAVAHGCLAGRSEEALADVYRDRILRGTGSDGFYSTKNLGAFGADLGAVACFFDEPWSRVSAALAEPVQAWLLNGAAFRLRALGRLREAVEPTRATLRMEVATERWQRASVSAGNLSEMELTRGNLPAALEAGEQAVTFADRSGDDSLRMLMRTTLADTLHQAGRRDEALARFREAEMMQAEGQPEYPLLTSLQGFRYCDLLLASAESLAGTRAEVGNWKDQCLEIERRVSTSLPVAVGGRWILDIALDHLTRSRARLYRAILEDTSLDEAHTEIEQAVDGLRNAGTVHHVPRGLLTRAWLRAAEGDEAGARTDLDEAQQIAERGPMPLYLADVHLYRARLFHDREALAEARRLVDQHGYGRRREELAYLEAVADGW